jgi:hypothetical protein
MKTPVVALLSMLIFAGCRGENDVALQRQVNALSLKVDSLIDALELQRENDSAAIDERSVVLEPKDSCAFIKTTVGYLTASVDSFQAFGNGTRVTLYFGNPGSVTLKKPRAYLEWEVTPERGGTAEMRSPLLYEFMEDLKPGSLTTMKVVVEDVPPERLRAVRVSRMSFGDVAFTGK